MRDGCSLARLAIVSREWQSEIERYNFARIKLTPSRLVDFSSMIHRNRALVRYIGSAWSLTTMTAPRARLPVEEPRLCTLDRLPL